MIKQSLSQDCTIVNAFNVNSCCGNNQTVKSINDCKFKNYTSSKDNTTNVYCCMLNVKVGAKSRSVCVPLNSSNYVSFSQQTNNQSKPFILQQQQFEYTLTCNEISSGFLLTVNYMLYLVLIIMVYNLY